MAIAQYGQTNIYSLITPGVLVQRVTPTVSALTGVASDIIGIVGSADWGPVNEPVTVGSYPEFQTNFGDLAPSKHDLGTPVATAIQQGGSDFRLTRVTDGTDTYAAANAVANANVGASFTAKYTGTVGNKINISFATGSKANTIKAVVSIPSIATEIYDNLDGTSGTTFWPALCSAIMGGSNAVTQSNLITANAGVNTATPGIGNSVTLGGGSSGRTGINDSTLLGVDGVTRTGAYSLRGQGVSVVALSDADTTTTWTALDSFARSEGSFAVHTGPSGDTIANAISNKHSAGLDSYASKLMFGDWLLWADPVNGIQRYVSPQGFVLGARAALSPNQSTLNATGSQFPLSGILGSQKVGNYTTADTDQLIGAGIDLIANPSPGGAFWSVQGGVTTSSNPAEVDESNTTMDNFLNDTLNAGMGIYVGVQVDDDTLAAVSATLNNTLNVMLSDGMLSKHNGKLPWTVVCSAQNNPDAAEGLGFVQANISVRFNGTLRHLILNTLGGSTVTP